MSLGQDMEDLMAERRAKNNSQKVVIPKATQESIEKAAMRHVFEVRLNQAIRLAPKETLWTLIRNRMQRKPSLLRIPSLRGFSFCYKNQVMKEAMLQILVNFWERERPWDDEEFVWDDMPEFEKTCRDWGDICRIYCWAKREQADMGANHRIGLMFDPFFSDEFSEMTVLEWESMLDRFRRHIPGIGWQDVGEWPRELLDIVDQDIMNRREEIMSWNLGRIRSHMATTSWKFDNWALRFEQSVLSRLLELREHLWT